MLIKLIKINTTAEKRQIFLERQRLWNDAMARSPGFIDAVVASDTERRTDIFILTAWRDRESLDAFMRDAHDRVEAISGIRKTYDSIEATHLNVEAEFSPSGAGHLLFGTGAEGIVALSEAYRGSAILRTALAAGFFEAVGHERVTLAMLAERLRAPINHLGRLGQGLAALGLASIDRSYVALTDVARRHLLSDGPAYLGHLVLHNTRPRLLERWGGLQDILGLANALPPMPDHLVFLAAMSDIATAGQCEQLMRHVDLTDRKRLLDIGGALGDYAISLAKAWPNLSADVLDLPETAPAARKRIEQSNVADRVRFVAGDYRTDLEEKLYDVVLLSNVIRGETKADAEALLCRIHATLNPGGLLIVQDLFPDNTAGQSGLLAAFFGLHLPNGFNPTTATLVSMMEAVGFVEICVEAINMPIVSNKLIRASVPTG